MYCPKCSNLEFPAFEVEEVHTLTGHHYEAECPGCGATMILAIEVLRTEHR